MIKLNLEIEGATALDTLAELRHLAAALDPGHDADTPAAGDTAPQTEERPKRTRKKAAESVENAPETVGGNVPPPAAPTAPVTAPAPAETAPAAAAGPTPTVTPPAAPVTPAPTPSPATTPAPAPAANVPASAPVTAPTSNPAAPVITLDTLAVAGSSLIDQGKMADVMALLTRYGVQAITQLKMESYAAFANDLRALGATI